PYNPSPKVPSRAPATTNVRVIMSLLVLAAAPACPRSGRATAPFVILTAPAGPINPASIARQDFRVVRLVDRDDLDVAEPIMDRLARLVGDTAMQRLGGKQPHRR